MLNKRETRLNNKREPIITVGICPVWDITNYVEGIEWGQHKVITSQTITPAGKPFNVSKALAGMSEKSVAAGLWGKSDYPQLIESLSGISDFIDLKLTIVQGRTRQNITVVDSCQNREIHLRAQSALTTKDNLYVLKNELDKIISPGSTVVFAGFMPELPLLDDCLAIIKAAIDRGAQVVIDTSGVALDMCVELGDIYMIKPNLDELSQLLSQNIGDDMSSIVKQARPLCDRVRIILISMGDRGALVVTEDRAIHCNVKSSNRKVVNTVSCGDYLLGGFLSQPDNDICQRLQTAVKLAAARAWGLTESVKCREIIKEIGVELNQF